MHEISIGQSQLLTYKCLLKTYNHFTIDINLWNCILVSLTHHFIKGCLIGRNIEFLIGYSILIKELLEPSAPNSAGARIHFYDMGNGSCSLSGIGWRKG